MPRFDGTGPMGMGAGTGRGLGPCGAGFRRGFGRSCPWIWGQAGNSPRMYLTRSEELESLKDEAKDLEADLKAVRERVDELKSN
ncbi:MAG: DUF5320 domain-containing protein [Candidatus Berkelbacteria bacterium]|nr:DUF5320 domain-containing protein [Candidatus Berkelbacteria bacterium]